VTDTAQTIVNNRNSASGRLRTLIYLGVNDVATHTDGARRALALAASAHETLVGTPPDDPEYTSALALLNAASAFVEQAQAAQSVISAPCNWRPKGSDIDVALAALGH